MCKNKEVIKLKKITLTQVEIIQVASELFFKVGYTNTSPKMIAEELDISTGNITYYFQTKDHLLLEVVQRLCEFQSKLLGIESDMGIGTIESICLELMTVVSACESSDIARDFFISTYQSELCRDYLRNNHVERAKYIFEKECINWTHEMFVEAEVLIMGIIYGIIASRNDNLPLKTKIKGALNLMLSLYNIDDDIKEKEISKVLSMDYNEISKKVLNEFIKFNEKANEEALDSLIHRRRKMEV